MGDVLVIAQILDGEVKKSTNSAVTFASQAASFLGGSYTVMVLGDDLSSQSDALAKLGAAKVLLAQAPGLDQAMPERWAPIVAQVVKAGGYQVVCSPSSSTGKDVLPRLSARLDAGMASDVAAVAFEGGKLTYSRPMYAGNVMGKVQVLSDLELVTVRQTEFAPAEPTDAASPLEQVDVPGVQDVDFTVHCFPAA